VLQSAEGERVLRKALASSDTKLVGQAAALIQQHDLRSCAALLADTFRSLASDRASSDAACLAKQALLAALEALDYGDADLFAAAASYQQLERVKGGTRDTAARVRVAGLLGLARLGHSDFELYAGAGLGDGDPSVRLAAAQAIAHRGHRSGAGLLLLRLRAWDEVPEIAIECLRGLFAIAPEHALRYAKRALAEEAPDRREHVLQALGSANDDRAVELLATELEQALLAPERERIIEALGLSRRSRARDLLLDVVREGRASDAEAALSALAIHRYDARLMERLEEAVGHSRELAARFRALTRA
jgi:hypothetical protein